MMMRSLLAACLLTTTVHALDSMVQNVILQARSSSGSGPENSLNRRNNFESYYREDGTPCFVSGTQLQEAADDYMQNGIKSSYVEHFGPIERWCTSAVSDFRSLFSFKRNPAMVSFTADIGGWDVSSATSMTAMFQGAKSFNASLSHWDVSQVVTMDSMFRDAKNFVSDISQWNVTNVEKMNLMFKGASLFDIDLSEWDVHKVTNMCYMFSGARAFSKDLCTWGDVLPITSKSGVFTGAISCTSQEDPDLLAAPAGPFCHACFVEQ